MVLFADVPVQHGDGQLGGEHSGAVEFGGYGSFLHQRRHGSVQHSCGTDSGVRADVSGHQLQSGQPGGRSDQSDTAFHGADHRQRGSLYGLDCGSREQSAGRRGVALQLQCDLHWDAERASGGAGYVYFRS